MCGFFWTGSPGNPCSAGCRSGIAPCRFLETRFRAVAWRLLKIPAKDGSVRSQSPLRSRGCGIPERSDGPAVLKPRIGRFGIGPQKFSAGRSVN